MNSSLCEVVYNRGLECHLIESMLTCKLLQNSNSCIECIFAVSADRGLCKVNAKNWFAPTESVGWHRLVAEFVRTHTMHFHQIR